MSLSQKDQAFHVQFVLYQVRIVRQSLVQKKKKEKKKQQQQKKKKKKSRNSCCILVSRSELCSQCRVMFILIHVRIESCIYVVNEIAFGCRKKYGSWT